MSRIFDFICIIQVTPPLLYSMQMHVYTLRLRTLTRLPTCPVSSEICPIPRHLCIPHTLVHKTYNQPSLSSRSHPTVWHQKLARLHCSPRRFRIILKSSIAKDITLCPLHSPLSLMSETCLHISFSSELMTCICHFSAPCFSHSGRDHDRLVSSSSSG